MREIIFRGKTDYGMWVYGDLLHPDDCGNGYSIEDFTKEKNSCFDVIPESIGQYTGLTDKNGTKIFEGDIVIARVTGGAYKGFEWPCADVQYQKTSFGININKDFTPLSSFAPTVEFEIIANKHDVAEQLGV